jgi:hypothetical protein
MQTTVIETYPAGAFLTLELEEGWTTHSFPAWREDLFTSKWDALVKRADRLGLDAPRYERLRLEERTWKTVNEDTGHIVERTERFLVVAVLARPVVLAGWTFTATIQHTPEGNILRQAPTMGHVVLPREYREAAASWCDHCRTIRRRLETFVIVHEDGSLMRVGRNCLADFAAADRDGTDVARRMNWYTDVVAFLDDLDGWAGERRGETTWDTVQFVARTRAVVMADGWVSRTKARENGGQATADVALAVFQDRAIGRRQSTMWAFDEKYDITEGTTEYADAALAWARDIDPDTDNDYLHNLRVACSFSFITGKEAGIVASVVAAYAREVEREEARRREAVLPPRGLRHVGRPGDKFGRKLSKKDHANGVTAFPAFTATVVSARWFHNDFGATCMVVMERTEDNNRDVFVWWASNPKVEGKPAGDLEVAVGDVVTVAGTVKKLDEYKGTCQTHLTRCALTLAE